MNRRGFRPVIALLALTLFIQTPVLAVGRDRSAEPEVGVIRIIKVVKKVIRNLIPGLNDEPVAYPKPPGG